MIPTHSVTEALTLNIEIWMAWDAERNGVLHAGSIVKGEAFLVRVPLPPSRILTTYQFPAALAAARRKAGRAIATQLRDRFGATLVSCPKDPWLLVERES